MTSLQICTQGASKQVETWWGVVWRGLHGPGRPRLPGPAPRSSSCALLRFADVEGLGRPCVWQVCRRRVPQRILAGLPESCSVLLTTVQTSPAIGDLGVACVMVSGRDELHPRALANLPGVGTVPRRPGACLPPPRGQRWAHVLSGSAPFGSRNLRSHSRCTSFCCWQDFCLHPDHSPEGNLPFLGPGFRTERGPASGIRAPWTTAVSSSSGRGREVQPWRSCLSQINQFENSKTSI